MALPEYIPEPKKIFLGFLIQRLMGIEESIYEIPSTTSASKMIGVIDSLDEESKKRLKKLRERLASFREDSATFGQKEAEAAYQELTDYLMKNYLQELAKGITPSGALPEGKIRPSAEKTPERLSQRLD